MNNNNSILLADDHPIVLIGLQAFLISKNFTVSNIVENGIEAFNKIVQLQPNIAILDLDMPGMSGIEIAEKLLHEKSNTKIIILTMHKDVSILLKCKSIGIQGYLLKDFALEELEQCLNQVINGETYFSEKLQNLPSNMTSNVQLQKLTPAELKILKLIANRKTSKEIAEDLFISEKTVEKHRSNIISKLNLPKDRRSLIEVALTLVNKI